MKLGRNDPCHCGSGKKYKKCHMAQDQQRAKEVKQLGGFGEWVGFYSRALQEHAVERARTDATVGSAARSWFDAAGASAPEDAFTDAHFAQHAVFDLKIAGGEPLVATSEADPTGTTVEQIDALRKALGRTWLSVHEVTACKRGTSIRLKDRLSGRERVISDKSLSEALDPLEVVLGRVVLIDKKAMLLPGWEKVYFRGRKKAIADLDAALTEDGFEADDTDGRILWLRREASRVAARARGATPAPAAEGQTAEARTAEGQTAEAQTAETRTAETPPEPAEPEAGA